MSNHLPIRGRDFTPAIVAAIVFSLAGCGISFEHDSAKTVTVVITGISTAADREEVGETLQGMTDGSSHLMTSSSSGSTMTIKLSPVTDVEAFSRKINFGDVTEVKDRTVKVTFVK